MRTLHWLLLCVACSVIVSCGDNGSPVTPVEPDAAPPTGPACDDDVDNDGDGKIDFPNDPGCVIPQADNEEDSCPSGADCPECGNGIDDNNDGTADYPADPGCDAASDDSEFLDDPNACGVGLKIKALPPSGADTGMLDNLSTSMITTTCGGGGGASAVAYLIHLAEPKVMIASTNLPGTTTDTVLDLRSVACSDPASHITCNDNVGTDPGSTITQSLAAGSYYLIVGGKDPTDVGSYELLVQFFAGEGSTCTAQADCGPGLVCRVPVAGTQMICTQPVCNDGADDDADGKIDYPADPGCVDSADATEDDDCPSGASCPACADGVDNDDDGTIDYPADVACASASSENESCAGELDPVGALVGPTTMSTLVGTTNEHDPSCGGNGGVDRVFTLEVPALATLVIDTNFSAHTNTILSLMNSTCTEPSIACDDNSGDASDALISRTNVPAGLYIVAVDASSATITQNSILVHVAGTVVAGESCEGALFQSGALTCTAGFACNGTAGSRTCSPAACSDGLDNNSNGKTDYPEDPGCLSTSDNAEDDVCPGASCPVCSDGLDNDNDNLIDYPADNGCLAASSDNEGCAGELDPIATITGPTTLGTLVGASDDHNPVCTPNNGADKIFKLEIPTLSSLVIDTEGSAVDTVLSLMTSACTEPSLACDDDGGVGTGDSLITRTFVAGGTYTIAVDADSATNNTFILNVHGTVVTGGSCEGALFQSGALSCAAGFACIGTAGARTCRAAECQDGIDNNADGVTDFPLDPGCSDASDNSEDTVCPGTSCPVCSDGIDNDGDGATDFPADQTCLSAAHPIESCAQSEPVLPITQPVTAGTTIGQINDFYPVCGTTGTHTAADVALELVLPVAMSSLDLELIGFTAGTHVLLDSTCGGTPVACSDPALMQVGALAAGTYYVVVDGFSTSTSNWTLKTSGTVAPGQSCEGALFQAGAFTCSSGFACKGTVGTRTCAPALCNDGVDNNADGTVDFPADPGCDTASDDEESNVCPGAACPVCADGTDNDGDTLTDYPADPSCFSASAVTEACTQSEPIATITQRLTAGTTLGSTNNFTPTCGTTSTTTPHSAGDVALRIDLPAMATLNLNLDSVYSAVHALLDSTCGGTAVACSNPEAMALTNLAAGTYYVVVDGFSTDTGNWTLDTTGTVAPGGSCEGTFFQTGAFTCTTGFACKGTAGARTCGPALCNDGVDNNGDGTIDYPNDPGCLSPGDDVEDDVACPGAACPVCFNTTDEDGDTLIDYPADFGCAAASSTSEAFCPIETAPAILVTTSQTMGSFAAPATDNYEQSCDTLTGNDVALALQLPVPVTTLVIDPTGSPTDPTLSFWDAGCGVELGCEDIGALTLTSVPAGNYAIQVDGGLSTTTTGSFLVTVRGTVAAGTACTDALFTSGVLVCPTGTTCNGTVCQ